MVKKVGFLALGGHISTQNASFKAIIEGLKGWGTYGLHNGFEAFKTGEMYPLTADLLDPNLAGFYAGATRATLLKDEKPDPEKIGQAIKFVKASGLDYLVGSGGDDHGMQMEVLRKALEADGIDCKVLVLSKTMDGDKGGEDGKRVNGYTAPFADTTNGFASAIINGSRIIHQSFMGAWTNETAYIITHFGREANWVGLALAWYGNCDMIVPGELDKDHPGHSIEDIVSLVNGYMDRNQREYGRRFAMVVVPEGTRIKEIDHVSKTERDAHGHVKLYPEVLGVELKDLLKGRGIKASNITLTYELRDSSAPAQDIKLAEMTGRTIVDAIRAGETGVESAIRFVNGEVRADLVPTELASQKRFAKYFRGGPLYNQNTFEPLPSIENYFLPLLGQRIERGSILPRKPTVVNVYAPH